MQIGIIHFCRWLQPNMWQSNENNVIIILNVRDGYIMPIKDSK